MTAVVSYEIPLCRWIPLPALSSELAIDPVVLRQWIWTKDVEAREVSAGEYEINVFSLPEEHRCRFLAIHPELKPLESITTETASRYTGARLASVRDRADDRAEAVLSYRAARAARLPHETLAAVEAAWLEHFKLTHSGMKVSLRSVKNWEADFTKFGIDGLVDGNDGSKQLGSSIPEQVRERVRDLYLQQQVPKLRPIYKRLCDEAAVSGWGPMPSYKAFQRYAESIPKMARLLAREHADTPRNLLPYVRRDPTSVPVYHTIQGDHRWLDIPVSCDNKKCRKCYHGKGWRVIGHKPIWTVWIDTHSRYIVGHELSLDAPETRRTSRGIGRIVLEHGVIPRFYVDNGADFVVALGDHLPAAKSAYQKRKLVKLAPRLAALGSEVTYALPGNPQGKGIIESTLRIFRCSFDEQFSTMHRTGGTGYDRDALPKVSEIAYLLQLAVDRYHHTPHGGLGMNGRTPHDVFNDPTLRTPRREADPTTFALLFFEPLAGGRIVGRLGVQCDGRIYRLAALEKQFEYFGERVDVRVWPDDPRRVILLDRKTGGLICDALLDEMLATYDTRDQITKWLIARTFRDVYALRRMAARAIGGDVQQRLTEHARVMLAYYESLTDPAAKSAPESATETLSFLSRLADFARDQDGASRNLSDDEWRLFSQSDYLARSHHLDADPNRLAPSPEDTAEDTEMRTGIVRLDRGLCDLCSEPVGRSRVLCTIHEVETGFNIT